MSYRNEIADRKVLEFVRSFHEENGYAPTIREVTGELGLASHSAGHHRVMRLIEEGALRHAPGVGRSLSLTKTGMVLIGGTAEL